MNRRFTGRLSGLLVALVFACQIATAAEPISALDLVSEDVAVCLHVPNLNETWAAVERDPMLDRLRSIPVIQRLLESRGIQHWQTINDHVGKQTGQKLGAQLRALLGRSLVLAIDVPATGRPRGILIGEAIDAAAVETALATLNKLEPHEIVTAKTHHGVRYQQRKKQANAAESTFIATSGRWVAVSDTEALVQDVIDRFVRATNSAGRSGDSGTLGQSSVYARNQQRLAPNRAAYLYVNARAWDRTLEAVPHDAKEPIHPAEIWKHISAVSASLQVEDGLVCDSVVELDTSRLPPNWSQFVATSAGESSWSTRIPAESLLAVSGQLDLAPFFRFFVKQVPERDRAELAKNRRIAESLLGGYELLDSVLPALARNVCGYAVVRKDEPTNSIKVEGAVTVQLSVVDQKLIPGIAEGLETSLTVLAAFFSAKGPDVVTVQREQMNSINLHLLSAAAPIPVAFGSKGNTLVAGSSKDRVLTSFELMEHGNERSRLVEHAQRFFPQANQLIWLDALQLRQVLERNGAEIARFLNHEPSDESKRLDHVRQLLSLVDSLFVAARIESDHIRVTFGGGLDRH